MIVTSVATRTAAAQPAGYRRDTGVSAGRRQDAAAQAHRPPAVVVSTLVFSQQRPPGDGITTGSVSGESGDGAWV
jgi:hypothetical protein